MKRKIILSGVFAILFLAYGYSQDKCLSGNFNKDIHDVISDFYENKYNDGIAEFNKKKGKREKNYPLLGFIKNFHYSMNKEDFHFAKLYLNKAEKALNEYTKMGKKFNEKKSIIITLPDNNYRLTKNEHKILIKKRKLDCLRTILSFAHDRFNGMDTDNDGIINGQDNCKHTKNPNQKDLDKDGKGDVCDEDIDDDGVLNDQDICKHISNPKQEDKDGDGIGDACDTDIDGDGIANNDDNCILTYNPKQEDTDSDGTGDACDKDIDGDGIANDRDNCKRISNPKQEDLDKDGIGDICDEDIDDDGVLNDQDNCIFNYNPKQEDKDGDGFGDACPPLVIKGSDPDPDKDGILNSKDNCKFAYNSKQEDKDGDGIGDACDTDIDGDGIANNDDNCILTYNPKQEDTDSDGTGDACERPPSKFVEEEFTKLTISFLCNDYKVQISETKKLDVFIKTYYQNCGDCHLTLYGFADTPGDSKYNVWLSKMRVKEVLLYLIKNGIDIHKTTYESFGEQGSETYNIRAVIIKGYKTKRTEP